mmetsp:Transcript_16353/g.38978  ORF Transcript_16353/g.38978 Transcript_16353/m.38978 type:complete len:236 (+) Transcript_16353:696-1403(+)
MYLHRSVSPRSTLSASSTMKPPMMALVVAMAGTILPAISFTSHRDLRAMWKTSDRRFEADVTKSSACGSSLSNSSPPLSLSNSAARCVCMLSMAQRKTAAFSSRLQVRRSTSAREAASGSVMSCSRSTTGLARSFHNESMLSSRCTSSSKTARKTRRANAAGVSPSWISSAAAAAAGAPSAASPLASPPAAPSAVSDSSTKSVSSLPKSFLKSSSLAHAMQCTGLSGWLRMVQMG